MDLTLNYQLFFHEMTKSRLETQLKQYSLIKDFTLTIKKIHQELQKPLNYDELKEQAYFLRHMDYEIHNEQDEMVKFLNHLQFVQSNMKENVERKNEQFMNTVIKYDPDTELKELLDQSKSNDFHFDKTIKNNEMMEQYMLYQINHMLEHHEAMEKKMNDLLKQSSEMKNDIDLMMM